MSPSNNARITKRSVDQLPPSGKEVFLRDTDIKGFGLRMTAAGVKSYFVEYRMGGRGAPKGRITLGKHGALTPEKAREAAIGILDKVRAGINPQIEKRTATREAVDLEFTKYAATFVTSYAKRHQPGSWEETERMLLKKAGPHFKGTPLPKITRQQIATLLHEIADTHPVRARTVHAILRRLFRWAVERGDIAASPMQDMPSPTKIEARERVLSDEELRAVWAAAEQEPYPFGPALKLLILTGQRRSEVIEMDFSEIDLTNAIWTIPAGRAKNGKAHIVPLSEPAIEILGSLGAKTRKRGFVFSTTGKTAISGITRFKARLDKLMLARMKEEATTTGDDPEDIELLGWRLHDIRRTVATGLQRLGVRLEVTEAVLNHVSGSRAGIVGVYQRHDWKEEKFAALETWGRNVTKTATRHDTNALQQRRGV